jgi:radical SAM-linked protein
MPLPLGVVGLDEVVELELDETLSAETVCARLAAQAPAGLQLLGACTIEARTTAHVHSLCYRLEAPPQRCAELAGRIPALLAASELVVERSRPQPRCLDVRPFVRAIRLVDSTVEVELAFTPSGTARPEEIFVLLGLSDVLEAGAILERTKLQLEADTTRHCPQRKGIS